MMKIKSIICIVVIMVNITGCREARTPEATPTEQSLNQSPIQAYPSPDINNQAGYPGPDGVIATPKIRPGQPVPTPLTDAPSPQPGKASISGTIYSFTMQMALPKTMLYLSRGIGSEGRTPPLLFSGPDKENGDIALETDENGNVFADNIPEGTYFMAVMAPMSWSLAVNSPQDEKLRAIIVKADEKYPLGIIYVSWP